MASSRAELGTLFLKAGNRQQVTDTANPTINYGITHLNQYRSASNESVTNGPEHEVSSFQGLYDTQQVNYHYLNDEHLVSVDVGGSYRYFFYDALGRCVKRSPTFNDGGNTTYYIYDGEKPIVEYGSAGGILGRNVYGKAIDEILMRTDPNANGGNPIYYAQDHEGSVTHLLDGRSSPATQTGNVIEQYHYDAYGLPTFYDANTNLITSTAYNNRFLFTGREYAATYRNNIYVPAFRFYEYRARAYHPDLGRFMSEDPKLFDAGDYNLFRYCHNDPIDFTDPMGLTEAAPAHSPREESYDQAMARAQWEGSDLMHANSAAGAIGIGAAGYAHVQQTTVTGELKGSLANPALLKNAKPGDPNDRDAPTGLEITNKVDDRGFYKQHHLEPKNGKGIWKGIGVAEEHNVKVGGNLRLKTSDPTLFGHGDLADRVGPKEQPGPNVTGYLLTHQTYKLYYPTPDGLRYINVPGPGFWQYTNVYRGQVTNADLGYWGH